MIWLAISGLVAGCILLDRRHRRRLARMQCRYFQAPRVRR